MENTVINGVPVEFGSSGEPIIEVHFMDTLDASPSVAPWQHRIMSYSNFNGGLNLTRENLAEFIAEKLPLCPSTQKVVVMFCKP